MKLECEACRELVTVETFRAGADGIEVTCPACAVSFYIASRGAPPVTPPAGPMECPKCGTAQPETDACRACGLAAARFAEFRAGVAEAVGELEALWQATLADWDEPAAHRRFLEAASGADAFAAAARRYREVLRERPGNPEADAALKRITRMAEAAMLARSAARTTEAESKEPYKNVLILLIALVLVAGVGAMYVMLRAAGEESPGRTPVTAPGLERR